MTVKRIVIVPYNAGSQSAKGLKKSLLDRTGIPTIIAKKDSTKYRDW